MGIFTTGTLSCATDLEEEFWPMIMKLRVAEIHVLLIFGYSDICVEECLGLGRRAISCNTLV